MSENKQLLTEWMKFDYTPDMIKESKAQNGGKVMLKGILQKADTLNQNGRIYPLAILEREVRNYQKFINENRALGELDHPDSSVVELKNASHVIREARMDGKTLMGVIEVLDTPSGKILQSLVESGITVGISSRGVGSTQREGNTDVVQDDFQLVTFDMVSEPSTPNAFMMKEGKQIQPHKHLSRTDKIDRIFNNILTWHKNV